MAINVSIVNSALFSFECNRRHNVGLSIDRKRSVGVNVVFLN